MQPLKISKTKEVYTIFLCSCFIFSLLSNVYSQSFQIRHVGQLPAVAGEGKHSTLLEKTGSLLFGGKEILMKRPFSLVADDTAHVLVLDQENGYLFQCRDGRISVPSGMKKLGKAFPSLVGICRFENGCYLFTDSRENKVYCYNPTKKQIYPFADTVKFSQPTGIAYSPLTREIWIVESAAHRIAVFNNKGLFLKHIGNRGQENGAFNYPAFIACDKSGSFYVVDCLNYRVQIFNPDGTFRSAFGEIGDASGYFARPKGIAIDSKGNIYVADALFHTVQIFNAEGKLLSYFGQQGQGKDDLWMPTGLDIDEKDFIYVADSYNHRIQIFRLEESSK